MGVRPEKELELIKEVSEALETLRGNQEHISYLIYDLGVPVEKFINAQYALHELVQCIESGERYLKHMDGIKVD